MNAYLTRTDSLVSVAGWTRHSALVVGYSNVEPLISADLVDAESLAVLEPTCCLGGSPTVGDRPCGDPDCCCAPSKPERLEFRPTIEDAEEFSCGLCGGSRGWHVLGCRGAG